MSLSANGGMLPRLDLCRSRPPFLGGLSGPGESLLEGPDISGKTSFEMSLGSSLLVSCAESFRLFPSFGRLVDSCEYIAKTISKHPSPTMDH